MSGDDVKYIGCLFIDDAIYLLNDKSNDKKQVVQQTQKMQSHLDNLLKTTGDAVNPEKCYWWMISFLRTHGTWKMKTKEKMAADLKINNQWETPVASNN